MAIETSEEWHGRIDATVADHDRDIEALKQSINTIRTEQIRTGNRVVRVRERVEALNTSVELLRGDLSDMGETIRAEFKEMREGRLTSKDLWKDFFFPILTLTIAGLLVYWLANGHHL